MCFGDNCLTVQDHNRPVNVYGYDPKVELKYTCVADVTVAYMEPTTGQVVILFINQVIEMKGLDHHLLCPMQCHMNGVLIHERFWHPFPVRHACGTDCKPF